MTTARFVLAAVATAAAVLSLPAAAQSFEVTSIVYNNSNGTANGTSNGVGWHMDHAFNFSGRSSQGNDSDFTSSYFSPKLSHTDQLHGGSTSFNLFFNQTVTEITFWVRDNNTYGATFNFGIVPTVLSGEIKVTGTAFQATTNGGVVRFSGLNLTELHNQAGGFDGADYAFSVNSPIPEPGQYALMAAGLGVLGLAARRRQRR